MSKNTLSPPISDLDRILESHQKAKMLIEQGLKALSEAVLLAPGWGIRKALSDVRWYDENPGERCIPDVRQALDSATWRELFDVSQLTVVMAACDVKTMKKDMVNNPPTITRESVVSTFINLYERRHDSFRKGLVDLFSDLRHAYRSNKVFKIGKKVILHKVLDAVSWCSFSSGAEQSNDLYRIMLLLDGKDPAQLDRESQLDNVIVAARRAGEEFIETDYFSVRLCKNGNIHYTFTRQELVDKANQLIADYYGSVLPDDR